MKESVRENVGVVPHARRAYIFVAVCVNAW
jgi:hypothetical protein